MVNKMRLKRLFWWIPAVFIMIIIFWFSSKNAIVSKGTSSPIANAILSVIEGIFGGFEESKHQIWMYYLNLVVRKAAHVIEYVVLAFTLGVGYYKNECGRLSLFWFSFILAVLYAATDEFHQLFVDGRNGQIMDVGIDSIGCLIGSLFITFFVYLIRKRKTINSQIN